MREKIMKILKIAGITALIFIPTYIAIASFFIVNSMPKPVNPDGYALSLVAPSGREIEIEDSKIRRMTELFLIMKRDATPSEAVSSDGGFKYTVKLSGAETANYTFLFFDDARGYMIDGESFYRLPEREVKSFISSEYAYDMYVYSELPALISNGTREILPYSASWKYLAYGGSMVTKSVPIRQRAVTYDHTGTLELSFAVMPDACNITVKTASSLIYSGDLAGFLESAIDESIELEYEIFAEWKSDKYNGNASYHFYSVLGKPAEFSIREAKFEGKYTEFIEVVGKNVGIPEDASLVITPSINIEPKFFADGEYVRALIPFGSEIPEGSYNIFVTYGDSFAEFDVTYTKRPLSDSENSLPAEDIETVEANRRAYLALIESICSEDSETAFISGKFIDPEDTSSVYGNSCSLLVGFGRIRYVGDTDVGYKNDGVVYRTHGGVYALNGGKVVKTGTDAWLGNYVVLDHGFGIKTFYAHLLSADVAEGETVKKGQSLGMAGNSGYTDKGSFGFLLITTVNGVPIEPYMLFEEGLS